MDLFTLVARLAMDTSDYDKKIKSSRSSFMELGSTISAKAVAFGNIMSQAITKAADAAAKLGMSTIEAAAEVEAEKAQFTATFGEMQGAAEKAFSNIEKSTGVFGTRLKNVGTKAFSQFKGAGLDGVDALSMMEKYTNLAADAAAYYDISLEDADARLRSFLRGNTEAGDAIGLFTSESQRNTYAMEEYGKKWIDLTEAQKQMLMLNVSEDIYKQSGAIGQASRESDAWTNVIGNLKEVWRQTKATFGAPIMAVITPKLQEFTEWLKGEGVQTKIEQFALGVADKIDSFFKWVANPTFPTWEEIKTDAEAKIAGINAALEGAINWTLGKLGLPDAETVISDVQNWWMGQGDSTYNRLKNVFKWTLGEWIAPSTEGFISKFSNWWNEQATPGITSITQWTFGELIVPAWADIVNTVYNWWTNTIRPAVKAITTWDFGRIQFPSLDSVIAAAQTWWNSVKDTISSIFTVAISSEYKATYPNATATQEEIDIISGPSYKSPGLATGLDYVPYNDFLARLHEGEAVLTKSEANAWRSGDGAGIVPIDYDALGAAVARSLDGAFVDMDKEHVGQLVLPTVSRGIAREAQSKRFA